MANEFLNDVQNTAELVSRMPAEDRERWNAFGHLTIESLFVNRIFIVYKPAGLTSSGQHREPHVLTTVKCVGVGIEPRRGFWAILADQQNGRELQVGHVPERLWSYPIYAAIPPRVEIRWDAKALPDGRIWRSLAFAMLVKTKNKSSFYSAGNTYCETPGKFRKLFPNVSGQQFKF